MAIKTDSNKERIIKAATVLFIHTLRAIQCNLLMVYGKQDKN
jgi:hypothetical protein